MVSRHAAVLTELDSRGDLSAVAAAAYLTPLSEGTPLERAAAGVLARSLARPQELEALLKREPFLAGKPIGQLPRLSRDSGEAWQRLWSLANAEAAVPALFDGAPEHGDLDLSGMVMTEQGLIYQGQRIAELGRGGYGIVDVHPKAEGVVLKTLILRDPARGLLQVREDAIKDDILTQRLSAAGLGPRGFGVSEAAGSPVVGKERVYGETVYDLIADARYGMKEHGLVLDLVDAMASQRALIGDLREPNIMVGATLAEPKLLRAWVIDGQALRTLPSSPAPEIRRRILESPTIRDDWQHDESGRVVGTHIPFLEVLERGLLASGAAGLWTRLKLAMKDRIAGPARPTPYAFPPTSHETPINLDGFAPRPPSPTTPR